MERLSYVELQNLASDVEILGQENDSGTESRQKSHGTLKEQSPSRLWRFGVPGVLLTIPTLYAMLLGIVASLHNQKQSEFGDSTIALYRAEKGSTLGALEFLSNSQTTISAFINLVIFGYIHVWTCGIAVIWCLSPLGGQAALRSIDLFQNSTTTQIHAMHYLGSNISNMNPLYQGDSRGDVGMFMGGNAGEDFIFNLRNMVASVFSTPDVLISHANGSSDDFGTALQNLGGKWQAARLGQQDL
ncbi:hypothetical protein NCS56_00948200 [Fusarium sp. Ph1]|nr:hypothetical protein NCS56_00948200 [Fusarium sp. Ph1]